ncbi:helix-turn-helix domain-containing protein [Jidongwangia harbinensis]|uniref:helix-turn-helix domain-containing protein n=1 Tax=Jidongwangia harbinensis TaxID=2878561 RepID=UPI001CD94754|nr:helix-turn-helix transcriptional regulator [Jidongwangia harbinensis]MCA2217932.1 helix-turn-helix domain-containing protein [Jidongwangia harbinensis]
MTLPTPTIGDRIRERRARHGWSVRHAASRAGISHASWSRIERGRQAADNRFMLADIAAALECAPDDLAGAPVPATDRAAMSAQSRVYGIRQALVDIDLSEPATRAAPPIAGLAQTAALVDTLRRACDYAGAAQMLPDLLRGLHATAGGPDREPALRLLCEATFIASSVVRNLGHPAEAWLGAERCRAAAEATGDPVLIGYAAYARSSAAGACGSFRRSLTLAARAVDELRPHLNRPGGLEMAGSLQLICAYAARGLKMPDDSETWIGGATELAGRTGETGTMGLFFGPTNIGIWRVGIEADGGDPARAMHIARAINPSVIEANFRQVFFYADTARALARLRGREGEAVRFLLVAERLAPQHVHTSALVQETTRALLERSRRAAAGAELRGLSERMRVG